MKIDSKTLRQKFFDFMKEKGHAILPSAPLVPKEDPTVLFINSGMQPLVPYLMGEPHPAGTRLADAQKVLRTGDIDEVGDNRHLSFFEMLGNWSLGDYFKKESLTWGFEFLTSEKWLGLDPNRLFVTVYKGFQDVPADEEAVQIWTELFAQKGIEADIGTEYDFAKPDNPDNGKFIYRITKKSGKDNWWGLPYRGPCGPCSEIYYLLDKHELDFYQGLEQMNLSEIENFVENEIVEIWNHVFMTYEGEWGENDEPVNLVPLQQKNIDTGTGLERILTVINGFDKVQDTDVLNPLVKVVEKWSRA
jgi:alanyl-tRNA synthetase